MCELIVFVSVFRLSHYFFNFYAVSYAKLAFIPFVPEAVQDAAPPNAIINVVVLVDILAHAEVLDIAELSVGLKVGTNCNMAADVKGNPVMVNVVALLVPAVILI